MIKDLKPCPFCGGNAVLIAHSTCSGEVGCVKCLFRSAKYWDEPMTLPEYERKKWKEVAADAWNRRTT